MSPTALLSAAAAAGTAGTVYTALFMGLRALDGSYAAGGSFHSLIDAKLQPRFAAAPGPLLNLNIFVLISMLATAFLAHYNAPKFFKELGPRATPTARHSNQRPAGERPASPAAPVA